VDIVFHICIMVGIYMILALSLNLLIGYAGLFSVGHGAFYGIGAYAGALLSTRLGLPFWIEIVLASAITGCVGYVIGKPILRLRDDNLALATFGLAVITFSVLNNWIDLTRGPLGIRGIPKPVFFSLPLNQLWSYALLVAACVGVTLMCIGRLTGSPFGKVLEAIREDDIAALAVGKDIARFKVAAFVISAFFAGLAGVLYAHYTTYIDPSSFATGESFLIFSMVIFGGMGSNRGAMVGAAVLTVLPDLLRFVGLPGGMAGQMRDLIYGALIVVVINWRPQGLLGKTRLE
jgi:branched-chain amino acid transport system permease protein